MSDSVSTQRITCFGLLLLLLGWGLVLLGALGVGGCTKRCAREQRRVTRPRSPLPRWSGELKAHTLPGSREPSGAVALPALGGLLVVDDEPSDSPSRGIHFLRVTSQGLLDHPVRFAAGQRFTWDDLEAVTATPTHIYLMGSHGQQDADRAQLCRIARADLRLTEKHLKLTRPLHCVGGDPQRHALERALERASREHGFTLPGRWKRRRAKRGGLNVEGLTFHPARNLFYVGLRSPLAEQNGRRYAILLTMRLSTGAAEFRYAGLVDLRGRGIRALARGPDGSIMISAGRVGKGGRFDIYRLRSLPRSPFHVAEPPRLIPSATLHNRPWLEPEGLAVFAGHLFVFSDSGSWPDAPAHYLRLPWRTREGERLPARAVRPEPR